MLDYVFETLSEGGYVELTIEKFEDLADITPEGTNNTLIIDTRY